MKNHEQWGRVVRPFERKPADSMVDILIVLQLLISIVLASQGIFYILGLAQAVKKISIQAFAEQRNAIDEFIATKLKFLFTVR